MSIITMFQESIVTVIGVFVALFLIMLLSWKMSESKARLERSIQKTKPEMTDIVGLVVPQGEEKQEQDTSVLVGKAPLKPNKHTTQKPNNRKVRDESDPKAERFADSVRLRKNMMTPDEFRQKWG